MRIGFDVAQTCVPRAGCGWVADLLAKALAETATGDEIFLYHHFGGWLNPDTRDGTRVRATNVHAPLAGWSVQRARGLWQEVGEGRAVLPGEPDVVHGNCFQAPATGSAKLVCTIYDVSFWVHPEFTTEENRLVCQKGTLEAVARADGLLFISEHTRQEFDRLLPGVCAARGIQGVVAPLASRFPLVESSRLRPLQNPWLAVGSLEPRKNYELLLDAMELYWPRSGAKRPLVIAGGGGWKSEALRARIDEMARRGLVRYEGYVDEARLLSCYQTAFALLFGSHYEGFGLPLAEAMSQGCPVISTHNSSLPEVGGEAALWCRSSDPEEFSELMLRLETDDALYVRASSECLAQARKFSWHEVAARSLEVYRAVLDRNGG